MADRHPSGRAIERYHHLLLEAVLALEPTERERLAIPLVLYRPVVRRVRPRACLRGVPQAMPAVAPPLGATAQAERRVERLEQVPSADEREPDDSGTHVRGCTQLDLVVRQAEAVRPCLLYTSPSPRD